jgi:hypothetical protein
MSQIHRMSQEERPIFWNVIVSAILSKKVYMCPIHKIQLFHCTIQKLLIRNKILCTVSNTGIYFFKWQSWYSLSSIIHFRKFQRQHECTLQLMWGHGVLLVCTVYSEIALSRKLFGIGHMYIYTFLIRMTDTMNSQNTDLSSWDTLYMPICTTILQH